MGNVSKIIELVIQVKDDTSRALNSVVGNLKKFDSSMRTSSKDTATLGKASVKTSKEVNGLSTSTRKFSKDASKGAKETKEWTAQLRKLGGESSTAGSKIDKSMRKGSASMGSFASLFGTIASLALPVVEFATFERSMSEVGAVAKASKSDLEAMTKVAEELGRTTEFSATQVAGGMKYIAMAGFDAEKTIAAIPGALDLALAGSVDLATAADITTNVLDGMNLSVKDLARVNDVLVEGFTSSNASLGEFGEALSYAAPVASGFRMSLESTVAALGLLHSSGIKGSRAGTNLTGILTRLATPTGEAAEVLDALASSIGKSSIEMSYAEDGTLDFGKTLRELKEAGITAQESMIVFGKIAGPGMIALLNKGEKAFNDYDASLHDVDGRSKEVSKAMHDNLVGTFKDTMSAVSGLAIAIGAQLKPAMEYVFYIVTKVASAVTKWVKDNEELAATIGTVAAAVGLLFVALQTLNIAMGLSSLIGGGLWAGLASKIMWLSRSVGALFLKGLTPLIASAGGLGAKVGTAFTTSFAGALSSIGLVLAAAFAGYSVGKLIEPWIVEIKIGGTRIATHLQVIIASFDAFFIKLKYGFKSASNNVAFFFVDILNQFATFAQDILALQKKIPGLGKVLGFAEDKVGITSALEFIKTKTESLQKKLDESYVKNKAGRKAELDAVQNLVDMIYEEEKAINAVAEAKAAGVTTTKVTETTEKISTEEMGTDFGKERTIFRGQYKKLIADIEADTKVARSKAEVAIARLQLDAAKGLISTASAEAQIHTIRMTGIENEATGYAYLQDQVIHYFGETSKQNVALNDLLNGLTTERVGLLIEQANAEKQAADELKRSTEQQMQLALQLQLLEAGMGVGTDLEKLQAKTTAQEAYYTKSIELKAQELAAIRAMEGASQADIIAKENEFNALKMEARSAGMDNYKAELIERLRLAEEAYARGTMMAAEYAAIVNEAWKGGIISQTEAADKTVAATGGIWENLKKGMADTVMEAQSLGQTMQDVGALGIDMFATGFGDAIQGAIDGTKSFKDAMSDMAQSFLKQIASMIAKQLILNALKSAGLGVASGGQVGGDFQSGTQGYASGGRVRGSSPTPTADNIPAWLTAGEFVQPVATVKHYGSAFMESIRTRSFDLKNALQGFASGGMVGMPVGLRLAEGGMVNNVAAPNVNVTTGDPQLNVTNVVDSDSMISGWLNNVKGEKGMINFIGTNKTAIKGILG